MRPDDAALARTQWQCASPLAHGAHRWTNMINEDMLCPGRVIIDGRSHSLATAERSEVGEHYTDGAWGAPDSEFQDEVNHPAHYGGDTPYEVIKVHEAWAEMFGLSFLVLNAIKYIVRAGRKPDVDAMTDLKKARWYINREINRLERIEADRI